MSPYILRYFSGGSVGMRRITPRRHKSHQRAVDNFFRVLFFSPPSSPPYTYFRQNPRRDPVMNRAEVTCARVIATSAVTIFLSVNEYAHYAERAPAKMCRESLTRARPCTSRRIAERERERERARGVEKYERLGKVVHLQYSRDSHHAETYFNFRAREHANVPNNRKFRVAS